MNKLFLKYILFFLLFLSIIFLSYSNTFQASWHLDDRPAILNNYYLHIDSLHPEKLAKTFYTNTRNPYKLKENMYRPVPCLSFALNWYFGGKEVSGYHLVNIVIHVVTAFLLFLFILNLFKTPNLKNNYKGNKFAIAFIASILWAANPIQTQAVTYIVQRMALMAAMFYIVGMFAYIKARMSSSSGRRTAIYILCFASYLLGINSKPNAAMLPIALVLIEIIFFQNLGSKKVRKRVFFITAAIAVLTVLIGSALFLKGDPLSFLNSYKGRSFTLTERLLAQPRVVVLYLSQIFYPTPDRFSIAHDIVLSSSLFKPWTTIPCILLITLLIFAAFLQIRKRPLLSFAILFFFLNHIIESSIIALEIVFEHRNYLPSFFLFLPVAYLLYTILLKYKKRNNFVYSVTWVFIVSLVISFSTGTFIRNKAWKNDITLWTDAVEKAPDSARASNILAIRLAWGNNSTHPKRYDMALKLFEDSLQKHLPSEKLKADIFGNMALIHFHKKNNHDKAIDLFEKALKINPGSLKIRRDFVNSLIIMRRFNEALKHADVLLEKNKNNGLYHNLKGLILLWQGKYPESLKHFEKAYEFLPDKKSVLLNASVALTLSGNYGKAENVLNEAVSHFPENLTYRFALIQNCAMAGNTRQADRYAEEMAQRFRKPKILHGLDNYTDNPQYAPLYKNVIAPFVENML